MELSTVIKLTNEAILMTLYMSAPVLIVSLVIGLIISIFQTTTSIQEQTLTFVPKFIAIFLAIIFTGSIMTQIFMNYTINIFLAFAR